MSEEKTILAIFDFDGTLSKGHLWSGIAKHHRAYKVRRASLYGYLLSHLPYWLAAKLKLYQDEKNRAKWGEDLPTLFKGYSIKEAQTLFAWVTENYFVPLLRTDVIDILTKQRKKGYKVMILSGMFTDFLEVIAQKIGVDYVVGTKLEVIDNTYSGRIIKPLCFGNNKAKCLMEFIKQSRLDVDFKQSMAYADSIYDNSVFQIVGNPVATYPDKELYKLARDREWQIIDDRHQAAGSR